MTLVLSFTDDVIMTSFLSSSFIILNSVAVIVTIKQFREQFKIFRQLIQQQFKVGWFHFRSHYARSSVFVLLLQNSAVHLLLKGSPWRKDRMADGRGQE